MAKRLNTVEMQDRKKSETIEWDDLILTAAKGQYGKRTRIVPTLAGKHEKDSFMAALFNDAKSINPQDPVEVSKNTETKKFTATPMVRKTVPLSRS